jgi:malonate-semialdehyde dehydrogenase (acetylating) / methylmalonate-semialdehyde dehydrogenase
MFVDKVVAQASMIKVGYGLDEAMQMGPIRYPHKKANVLKYIEAGIKEGAKLTLDGRKAKIIGGYPDDCFLGPSIFENVDPKSKLGAGETFSMVMSIRRVKDLDESISISYENPYGNGHSIFTQNGKAAWEFQYDIASGNVGIIVGITALVAFLPFCGAKNSSFGVLHSQGKEDIRFFNESKVVIQRWF